MGVQGQFRGLFLWDPHTHHMQVRDHHSLVGVPHGCGGLWGSACGGPTTGNLVTVSHGLLVVPLVGTQVRRDFRTPEGCAVPFTTSDKTSGKGFRKSRVGRRCPVLVTAPHTRHV